MPWRKKTWILVADGARAHILLNRGPATGLEPVGGHDFAAPLPPTRELGSDRPGRTHRSADSTRAAMEPRVDWHAYEKHLFAKSMAKVLDEAAMAKAFDRLVLVAPPRVLGELRAALGAQTRALVKAELNKDLTHLAPHELLPHLADVLLLETSKPARRRPA